MAPTNVPCDTALEIDAKLDDGNLATGTVQAPNANCQPGSKSPVAQFVVAL